jgi:hypothetical protein
MEFRVRAWLVGVGNRRSAGGKSGRKDAYELCDEFVRVTLERRCLAGEQRADGAEHAPADTPRDGGERQVGQCGFEVRSEGVGDWREWVATVASTNSAGRRYTAAISRARPGERSCSM